MGTVAAAFHQFAMHRDQCAGQVVEIVDTGHAFQVRPGFAAKPQRRERVWQLVMHSTQGLEAVGRNLPCHQQHTGVARRVDQFDLRRKREMPQHAITLLAQHGKHGNAATRGKFVQPVHCHLNTPSRQA
ncbi:hypothetical protein GY26_18235 [Gammaproteobacteria bacterium MFB021]|nr:hypothetical protein GY26_18235 [Gammaproteobacteria bacterium MFB021]